jgi:hypothetical protein
VGGFSSSHAVNRGVLGINRDEDEAQRSVIFPFLLLWTGVEACLGHLIRDASNDRGGEIFIYLQLSKSQQKIQSIDTTMAARRTLRIGTSTPFSIEQYQLVFVLELLFSFSLYASYLQVLICPRPHSWRWNWTRGHSSRSCSSASPARVTRIEVRLRGSRGWLRVL